MPLLRLKVLDLESFWLGFWGDLTEKCCDASGFQAGGILVVKNGCPWGNPAAQVQTLITTQLDQIHVFLPQTCI